MTDTEKNIKCAEILGWVFHCKNFQGYSVWHHPSGAVATDHPGDKPHQLPNYLTDANAALELVEWMRKDWYFECYTIQGKPPTWHAKFRHLDNDAFVKRGLAPTFCTAIVDAFLKANGVEL